MTPERDAEGVVEEWRVTADPVDEVAATFGPYDFSWRGPTAEADARRILSVPHWVESMKNVKIMRRTITYSGWEEVTGG